MVLRPEWPQNQLTALVQHINTRLMASNFAITQSPDRAGMQGLMCQSGHWKVVADKCFFKFRKLCAVVERLCMIGELFFQPGFVFAKSDAQTCKMVCSCFGRATR